MLILKMASCNPPTVADPEKVSSGAAAQPWQQANKATADVTGVNMPAWQSMLSGSVFCLTEYTV